MNKRHAYCILLAGGRGERFWPLSRRIRPKQCLKLFSKMTMIEEGVNRLTSIFEGKKIFISTGKNLEKYFKKLLPHTPMVIEPEGRDTAACIGLATLKIFDQDPEAQIFVETTDHLYPEKQKYVSFIQSALPLTALNKIILIGITPTSPHTGYGYIKIGQSLGDDVFQVDQFREKPDKTTAQDYLQSGGYLWNSGMFIFKARVLLDNIEKYQPALHEGLQKIYKSGFKESVLTREFKKFPRISIDYGLIEKSQNTAVLKADFAWEDVGDWRTMYRLGKNDKAGNVLYGSGIFLDSRNNLFFGKRFVGMLGVENLIVVEAEDALLITTHAAVGRLKDLVSLLNQDRQAQRYL